MRAITLSAVAIAAALLGACSNMNTYPASSTAPGYTTPSGTYSTPAPATAAAVTNTADKVEGNSAPATGGPTK